MDGLEMFGPGTTELDYIKDLDKIHGEIFKHLNSRGLEYVYRLYAMHNDPKMRNRNFIAMDRIRANFKKLDRVAIVGSSSPIALTHFLKKEYNAKVTLVSDHPSFELSIGFFERFFKAETIFKSVFFEDVDLSGFDLVVLPEFEYLVPLDMLNHVHFGDSPILALQHIQHVNDHNSRHVVMSVEDLLELLNLKPVFESGSELNIDGRNVYYALGTR
jgi:hypothetical protein